MKFNKEAKQAFFDAFLEYQNAGETFAGAYNRAREDFNAEHKLALNLWTFRKWYKARMNGEDKPEEAAETAPEETAAETEGAEEIPEEVPEEEADAAMSADDYMRRLELVCRMYRTHSEESRDDICDYLLPDLCRTAEE